MAPYSINYKIRYQLQNVQAQIEVAVISAAQAITNEAPSTTDHANRMLWASWAMTNSSVAFVDFAWAVAMNPAIIAEVNADPTGNTVVDSDVQFVVNSYVQSVVTAKYG